MSHSKFMRATLFATAILVPLVAGLSPVLAEDREDHAVTSAPRQHEAMAAAHDLLDVNGEMKRLEAQFPAMADAAQRAIKETPVIAKAKIEVRQMALNLLSKHKAQLKGEIAKVYSAIFTVEELKGFTAFFRGPTGARFQLFATTLAANHDSDRRSCCRDSRFYRFYAGGEGAVGHILQDCRLAEIAEVRAGNRRLRGQYPSTVWCDDWH